MAFDDLLEDIDDQYKGGGAGNFVTEDELLAGFEGKFLGYEKKPDGAFGPSVHWKFEMKDGSLKTLNRPSHRKDLETQKNKPTRFFISFMNSKVAEGDLVRITQKGKGFNIEYEIEKPKI